MNLLLEWLGRPEWEPIVRTLAHSIWQGALLAGALAVITRRFSNPVLRYRLGVSALALALTASVVTWAVIGINESRAIPASVGVSEGQPLQLTATSVVAKAPSSGQEVISAGQAQRSASIRATGWIALLWLAGAVAMLVRAGIKVAGAETLRRSGSISVDPALTGLLEDARRSIGLSRQVRLAVTAKLTSPVVVGWLAPTLIVPLALATTMTPEQIRFILLHELAHIRRGDYFVNLFQLLVESVFFFNPAIWWISHQIRREREACCDALASRLGGEPVDYARTLIEAAERGLEAPFAAAPALGERQPSQLTERVRRILLPDYRPSMRLTWRAASMFLVLGGVSLMLSAVGARVAVAAIMTPQERVEHIDKKMAEYGQKPEAQTPPNGEHVTVTVRIKTPDGSPLPQKKMVRYLSVEHQSSGMYGARIREDGTASGTVSHGQIWIDADVEDYAPAIAGPFDGMVTNEIDAGELILSPGFDTSFQVTDAKTGQPIPGAELHTQFWLQLGGSGYGIGDSGDLTADASGRANLPHCADQPITVKVSVPGYEIGEQKFEHLKPGQALPVKLNPGAPIGGEIVDKLSGAPVLGATVRAIYEKGPKTGHYEWNDFLRVVAETDSAGRFAANRFRRDTVYWLGVTAPGHESLIVSAVRADTTNLSVRLGPELVVRGRVIGDLSRLSRIDGKPSLCCTWSEVFENNSYGHSLWAKCQTDGGMTYFEFTQPFAAMVTLSTKDGQRFERMVDGPINDWVIDLSAPTLSPTEWPKREVIFRFKYPGGVPPQGTVAVTIPDNMDPAHRTAHTAELQITNGQVSFQGSIGGYTDIEPRRLPGYWFDRIWSHGISNGIGPMVIDVPLAPAGAIFARAFGQNGFAERVFFCVEEIERAPSRSENSPLANPPSTPSDRWVSGPLPLGGVYQIVAWRDHAFAVSKRIKLTEKQPEAEIELRVPAGRSLAGVLVDPTGKPVPNVGLGVGFVLNKPHSFGFESVFTDEQGRFEITGATPEVGRYSVTASVPGLRAERVEINPGSASQQVQLKKGLTLSGTVIESDTGRVIPNAEVRAVTFEDNSRWPEQKTTTDAQGRFRFTTLGDAKYRFYLDGGQQQNQPEINPSVTTNLTIPIKLYSWSKLTPVP